LSFPSKLSLVSVISRNLSESHATLAPQPKLCHKDQQNEETHKKRIHAH
jgi:hypothetical protein